MSDFQKKLEEMQRKREQEQLAEIATFKTYVQQAFPTAVGTPSGLHYLMHEAGTGNNPGKHQTVHVHYTGKLTDGTVFDTSYKRGAPIAFPIGAGRVIKGWDEGIALLREGGKATLIIPYFLAYGKEGRPPVIPPAATLIFDVELVKVG